MAAQYLTFVLGKRTFALSIEVIAEIIKYGHVTPVPRTPAHIRGVINLRGAVLPVLDLNVYVGQPAALADGQSCIVVIQAAGSQAPHTLGLMVDSVSAVLTMADEQIEPVPAFGTGLPPNLLTGLVRNGDRFIAVLDVAKAFSVAALAQRQWSSVPVATRLVREPTTAAA